MNRIDRLHAIATHLQSKKRVTAQELADRFSISLRTVYRDVKALDESGVPVIGEAGTGYTIMEGYRLPPVMFTQEEASALLLGSKLAERFTDGSVKKHFSAALFKIKAVLRGPDKEYVESLTDSIEILSRRPLEEEIAHQYLSLFQQAIVHKKIVEIKYHGAMREETTIRAVEPIGLLHYSSAWHLIAWCRLRNDYRDFRLSRMLHVNMSDSCFDASSHPSVQEYLRQITKEHELEEAVILLSKTRAKYIQEQKYMYGFVSEEDQGEVVRMKFMISSIRYFGHWLLMCTHHAQVESPESLKTLMSELGKMLYQHYSC